nr:F-box/FBD/LRR-repeat protein At1g13570-like [Ipomoea batatas]
MASSRRIKSESNGRRDIISQLPGDLKDKILECLPTRDAARIALLSTEWRDVWLRHERLVFDNAFFFKCAQKYGGYKRMVNILDHVIIHRAAPVKKFTLSNSQSDLMLNQCDLDRWCLFLSRNGVEELSIALVVSGQKYDVPIWIVSCPTIRHLNLEDHLLRICQNERVLLPSIEPKIVPEDVCVTEELDPEEHPEESRRRPWKAFEKGETADQPQKQPREQRGKLCLELRGKPEEYLLGNHQPEIPSGIPHSQSHNWGSEEILLLLREVVGASLPSPHQKEWGEGPRGYPPPRDHRVPASAGRAFLGEPARLNEENAVKEDQRHLSSSLQVV